MPKIQHPWVRKEIPDPEERIYSYGRYYPYFVYAEKFDVGMPHLNMMQTLHIDNTIRQYNKIIIELVAAANEKLKKRRFYLVDISSVLSDMALKRKQLQSLLPIPFLF